MGYSTYRFGDNGPIPYTEGPRRLLAPFWDDLISTKGGSDIYVAVVGDAPNRKLVVEWWKCQFQSLGNTRHPYQKSIVNSSVELHLYPP